MSQIRRHSQLHHSRHTSTRPLTLVSSNNSTVHSGTNSPPGRRTSYSGTPPSPTGSLFGGDNIEDGSGQYNTHRYHNAGQGSSLIPPTEIAAQLLGDLRAEITYLRRRVTEQDGELARLRHALGQSEGLQAAFDKLLQELEAMRARNVIHDPEYGVPLGPQLDPKDYKYIKYWFADDFKDGEMILDLDDEVYDGKFGFIEDERGRFVGVRVVNNITGLARLIFCQLVELGIWPRYWRRISIRAFALFAMRMYESYPFLRLCAGDWKVRAIGRDQYSGWFNKNPELKALLASSNMPELEDDDDDDEDPAPARPKRRRTKQADGQRPPKKRKTAGPALIEAGPSANPVPIQLDSPPAQTLTPPPPATPAPVPLRLPSPQLLVSPSQGQEDDSLAVGLWLGRGTQGSPAPHTPSPPSPCSSRHSNMPPYSPILPPADHGAALSIAPAPQRLLSAPPTSPRMPMHNPETDHMHHELVAPRPPPESAHRRSAAPAASTSATVNAHGQVIQPGRAVAKTRIPPPLARAIAERQRLAEQQVQEQAPDPTPREPAPRPPVPAPVPAALGHTPASDAPQPAVAGPTPDLLPRDPGPASSAALAPPPIEPAARGPQPAAPAVSKGDLRTAPIKRDSKEPGQQLKVLWHDELVAVGRHPSNGAWRAFGKSEEGKARLKAHKAAAAAAALTA